MDDQFSHVDGFKIRVDQLRQGHVEEIEEVFGPEFLDVHEDKLAFIDPVFVKGEAYTAEAELILRLNIKTVACLPCTICNEQVKCPIELKELYASEPLEEIRSGVFSMLDLIREAILLETPQFAECHLGKCPKRKTIEKFLKKEPSSEEAESTYRPFEGLKMD